MPIPSDVLEATTAPVEEPALGTGPIVVATDGTREADAALRAAWSMAGRMEADVQVVSAVAPIVPVVEFGVMIPLPPTLWKEQRESRLSAVREQLQRVCPQGCDWPIAIIEGEAGDAIAKYSTEERARLLVMGRGRHGLAHRLREPEVVLRVLRFSDVPVLAVEADAPALPRQMLVATDFSPYSTYAARVALSLAAPDAVVYLAHVRPRPLDGGPATEQSTRAYDEALPAMFARLRDHLSPSSTVAIEYVSLIGDPVEALIDFATTSHADLIVCGTHGYGFIHRILVGSVATRLLRSAPCSLLCVPGSAVTHAAARSAVAARFARTSIPVPELARALADFAKRNGGRICSIEFASVKAHSRVLASGVPFLNATFERDDGVVLLHFGTVESDTGRLTHTVRGVSGVDRLTDPQGVDRGLVVFGSAGTTSLSFPLRPNG